MLKKQNQIFNKITQFKQVPYFGKYESIILFAKDNKKKYIRTFVKTKKFELKKLKNYEFVRKSSQNSAFGF
ncbi:MAG: hypothetical protein EAZ97_07235 [Bacteroidetes bacterium]|nr:MAG: hypothetical protein EAZ97_07235 [Bacteroidota bacterium]